MRIRIIDYVGNLGGGMRYTLETMRAMAALHPDASFEMVSDGTALEHYTALFRENRLDVKTLRLPPGRTLGQRLTGLRRIRGMTRLLRALGLETGRRVGVQSQAVEGCDAVWLPWLHLHTMPDADVSRVVGTFHDAIFFQFPRLLPAAELAREREGIGRWLASSTRIVVTSNATAAAVSALFSVGLDRLDVIRVSGEHARSAAAELPAEWTWARDPFLIYPANLSYHKNHETLMRGLGRSGVRHPLVLTGEAADLRPPARGRAAEIRRVAQKSGLRLGERLHTLGYVSSGILQTLIERAWALVMPTMGEGGGSFPTVEALLAGVPVICSDIPVLREQMKFLRAEVLWFDPQRPADLAEKLDILAADYPHYKSVALAQREALSRRSWLEVADEYWRVFNRTGPDSR